MIIVAGLSLKNLHPRVWDPKSEYFIPALSAVMISYAEFHQMPARRAAAMKLGLRGYLGIPDHISIYSHNGAFYFGNRNASAPFNEYEEFVDAAKPDWKPIPQDYIPAPSMSRQKHRGCFDKTMRMNLGYQHNGYVPVVQHWRPIFSNTRLKSAPTVSYPESQPLPSAESSQTCFAGRRQWLIRTFSKGSCTSAQLSRRNRSMFSGWAEHRRSISRPFSGLTLSTRVVGGTGPPRGDCAVAGVWRTLDR